MNTRFKVETQCGRKPPLLSSLSSFINKKIFLQSCTGADSYQYAGTHLQKATTFSRFPAPTGRELQPPPAALLHLLLLRLLGFTLPRGFSSASVALAELYPCLFNHTLHSLFPHLLYTQAQLFNFPTPCAE
jgi:hypothetical protein